MTIRGITFKEDNSNNPDLLTLEVQTDGVIFVAIESRELFTRLEFKLSPINAQYLENFLTIGEP